MTRHHTPPTIRSPFAHYSHGVEVPAGARLLVCSGQLGVSPDDQVPEEAGAQSELCLANIAAILASAGMAARHIVRLNAYVCDRADLGAYMAARDRFLAGIEPPPASTLMIVAGFARPEFKVEIEAIAADYDRSP